jgi:PRTRC genetic system protein E
MFKELAPVLRHRAVLMTITFTEDDQIRVNVVPKKLKDDENTALTTPLTVTGTAEELDAELGSTLVDFVASHLQLKNTLKQAKEEMEEAAKAAQAEARAKSKAGKKEPSTQTAAKTGEPAKAIEPPKPAVPRSPSLFDMGSAPAAAPTPDPISAAPTSQNNSSDEEEILAELDDENEGEEGLQDAA